MGVLYELKNCEVELYNVLQICVSKIQLFQISHVCSISISVRQKCLGHNIFSMVGPHTESFCLHHGREKPHKYKCLRKPNYISKVYNLV